jgi:hypothetical protein
MSFNQLINEGLQFIPIRLLILPYRNVVGPQEHSLDATDFEQLSCEGRGLHGYLLIGDVHWVIISHDSFGLGKEFEEICIWCFFGLDEEMGGDCSGEFF